jgi:dTDP-4-dehydrorhamnose 3,5-epimerase
MRFLPTTLPGCFRILPPRHADPRGGFVKTFHREDFARQGLAADFAETYFSTSRRGVLRGLHFQTPPAHHAKLVYCLAGAVLDAALDLRAGSPTFGAHETFNLDAAGGELLYLPAGLAHGFYVTGGEALMMYHVTTVYDPAHDAGILWSSAGIPWPDPAPLVSERDGAFPALTGFATPFRYEGP